MYAIVLKYFKSCIDGLLDRPRTLTLLSVRIQARILFLVTGVGNLGNPWEPIPGDPHTHLVHRLPFDQLRVLGANLVPETALVGKAASRLKIDGTEGRYHGSH